MTLTDAEARIATLERCVRELMQVPAAAACIAELERRVESLEGEVSSLRSWLTDETTRTLGPADATLAEPSFQGESPSSKPVPYAYGAEP